MSVSVPAAELAAVGFHLAARRDAVLARWRALVAADPMLTTGRSLPIAQLHDHLTALLEAFERHLQGFDGASEPTPAEHGDAVAHGLHRWQEGYSLVELARELGRLNESMVTELELLVAGPACRPEAVSEVRRMWAAAHGMAVGASAEQFAKLQQVEAAGQVQDLEAALDSLQALESERALLWQEAAHDLRGNLNIVSMAAQGLSRTDSHPQRDRFLSTLSKNVRSLGALLADVTGLARLQGGQEVRSVEPMDAAALLTSLAQSMDGLAADRRLELRAEGDGPLQVEGDAPKVSRVVQNLLLNALRYTTQGSVVLSWGPDPQAPDTRWFAQVKDTGPGLPSNAGARLASSIEAASLQARVVAAADAIDLVAHIAPGHAAATSTPAGPLAAQAPGEGIGLSIVKRLCSLLDATLELESHAGTGTTVRAVFPRGYDRPPSV